MWVQHSTWIVQDDGLELAIGDSWNTRLEVSLEDAEEVSTSTPFGLTLAGEPLTTEGPVYVGVAKLQEVEPNGKILDTGTLQVAPTAFTPWAVGTTLKFRSALYAQPCLFSDPPDPLIRGWAVRQILVRQWNSVPDKDPDSYRIDRSTVRFRSIERMQKWEDELDPTTGRRVASDYLLKLV